MRCFSSRSYSNLTIPLLLFFLFRFASERLSIQYVYERNFFVFRLSLKAGAKLKLLFVSRKKKLKNFETFFSSPFPDFPSDISMNFPCFAGCKCKNLFLFLQAFPNLFFRKFLPFRFLFFCSISMSVFRCCGCKSTTFIYIRKPFVYIISMFFKTFS